jgi:XTP/dITP diphosphohydrolase
MKIVFASNNSGKIRELNTLLAEFSIITIPQSKLGVEAVAETGLTFVENALIKARHACAVTGQPALADDSGLVVTALKGAPGIYSARYAGENATDAANIEKLLTAMQNIPEMQRNAAFHCVLVFLLHAKDPTPLICHGVWEGSILAAKQGDEGFGYDPVFYDTNLQKTAAQLPLDIKNRSSHRGKALRLLMTQLPQKVAGHVSTGK